MSRTQVSGGWFKSPRNRKWTIDSTIGEKAKPSGYDSNTLITIIRILQSIVALVALVIYLTTRADSKTWLFILACVVSCVSAVWSFIALLMRHRWSALIAAVEVAFTAAWIVWLVASFLAIPEDSRTVRSYLGPIAIETSTFLMLPTCLLVMTPLFHKMMPSFFGVKKDDNGVS
ncbi:hypothetical protein M426DRAFT_319044 [Hypoxylon sp. CI-4A]|nr:hypothetical protein M426DRAFT_319044 [Hypoxylon sp. CI-4A]